MDSEYVGPSVEDVLGFIKERSNPINEELNIDRKLSEAIDKYIVELREFVNQTKTFNSTTSAIEHSGRPILYAFCEIEDRNERVRKICNLLDLVLVLIDRGACDLYVNLIFLEDVLESQTIEWCQSFWPYFSRLEPRLTQMHLNGLRQPGTIVIRCCNSVLRRLSKTQNSVFSGRIHIFLARVFPLSERSGLNQRGEFNTENITEWEDETASTDLSPSSIEEEAYAKFWSLQAVFSDPTMLLQHPEQLVKTEASVRDVILMLKRYASKTTRHSNRSTLADDDENTSVDGFGVASGEGEGEAGFVPKWLTSKALFELELHDQNFRRAILVQIAILCDFIVQHGVPTRENSSPTIFPNKAVAYPRAVPEAVVEAFETIKKSILTPSSGYSSDLDPLFTRPLRTIIQRDLNWQRWKQNGNQPPLELPPVDQSEIVKVANEINQYSSGKSSRMKRPYRFIMGTPALARLHATSTDLNLLKDPKRTDTPRPEIYCEALANITDDQDDASDLKESASWRALRAARMNGMWSSFA
ncbi:THO complex, subunit THOC1, partial [Dipodascopsis uninucleata]